MSGWMASPSRCSSGGRERSQQATGGFSSSSTRAPLTSNETGWARSYAARTLLAGATHFFVYNSMASEVLDTVYAPIDLEIDIEARTARLSVAGVVESTGSPIINPHSGEPSRSRINLPNGFEYTVAEMGSGSSKITAGIELELTDS